MKKANPNGYLLIGLILSGGVSVINRIISLPAFMEGIMLGVGVAFILLGAYAVNHDVSKLRDFKKNMLKKWLKSA